MADRIVRSLLASLTAIALAAFSACAPAPIDRCRTTCERTAECVPATAALLGACRGRCESQPDTINGNDISTCTNRAEIEAAIDRCNSLACSEWVGCAGGVPACAH